jgi:cytochrome c biogenesis protein CcdA/glutaredoxin
MKTTKTIIKIIVLLVIGIFVINGRIALAGEETDIFIVIDCFYSNACASCNEETKLIQEFQDLIGDVGNKARIVYNMHNAFHTNEMETLTQYYKIYNVPENERFMPILFIGDKYLPGIDEIKKSLKSIVNEEILINQQNADIDAPDISEQAVNAEQKKYIVTHNKTNDTELIYFFLPSCEDCGKAEKALAGLPSVIKLEQGNKIIYSNIKIVKLNAGEEENLAQLKARFEYLNVPVEDQQVPIVFLGNTWFSGAANIQANLKTAISNGQGIGTVKIMMSESQVADTGVLNFLSVFLTGLLNGINPCSLSMLIFFLSVLVANENTKLFTAGMTFIAGKFLAFVLLGTLFYRLFLNANFQWFQTVSKIILICIGTALIILNIRDYFAAKGEKYNKILLQLPERLRKFDHSLIKTVSAISDNKVFVPVCFILGVLIAAGEFLCTGQIYLATIVLMLRKNPYPDFNVLFSFIIYGIAFVLPLFILTVLLSKGRAVFEVSEAVREKMPLIKLVNALFFLMFIILVIFVF